MADLVEIGSGALSAAINPFGAELTHLRDAEGRELMTNADPAFWTGHAPILFPIVGAVHDDTYRVDGGTYHLPKHGFARRSTFALREHQADRAVFSLTANDETRAVYPFDFDLQIAFEIAGSTLTVTADLHNPTTDQTLPASFGFHPAFAWPLPYDRPRADHRIVFDHDEPAALCELTKAGLIATGRRPSPLDDRTLHLADALFADDALIWDPVVSQEVRYGAPEGPQLLVEFPDTPMLGVWTKPGAAYICIEPWHGIADPDGYTGDFRAKPGIVSVPAIGTARFTMRITLDA